MSRSFCRRFYQANLTFGCNVAVSGDPLALTPAAAIGDGGVGGQFITIRAAIVSRRPAIFTIQRHHRPGLREPRRA